MTDFLGKKYRVANSENFDEYLQTIGASERFRKVVVPLVTSVQLLEEGGTFTFKTFSEVKDVEMVFQSGVPFEEQSQEGSPIKSTVTVSKNKMLQLQKYAHIDAKIERTFSDTELVAVLTAGDVVCTRTFKLVQ